MMIFVFIIFILFVSIISFELWNHGNFDYFGKCWCKISELINVSFAHTLTKLFVKSNGYKFGRCKDRVGYVMGINKRLKTLTKHGLRVEKIFNFFDKDHLEKTILKKKQCT